MRLHSLGNAAPAAATYIHIRRIDRIPCLVLEETIRLKVRHNVTSHRFRRRAVADFTLDHYLTVRRRFVRIVDAGEPFDFAGACELVEAFGVPGFAHLKRHVQEHLYKRVLGQQIATRASVASVGRYEAGDADEASVGEQLRYFPYSADVLGAVLCSEAQVPVQPVPEVVAVEDVRQVASAVQLAAQRARERAFP